MSRLAVWGFLLRYGVSIVTTLWKHLKGRWFVFQDAPDRMVRTLAVLHKRYGKDVDASDPAKAYFEAALEEYTARKRKIKIEA